MCSEEEYTKIAFKANGSGKIEILMNGYSAGIVEVCNGKTLDDKIAMESGEYELQLAFSDVRELEIIEILLK